jgi:hypothetical protein
MNTNIKYLYRILVLILLFAGILSCSQEDNTTFSDLVKVSLRDVGHQLLLTNQDSTSLVQPVVEVEDLKYQLLFEKPLTIHPDSLVNIIKSSFQKAELPKFYLTEVIRCEDNEVAYSYKMNLDVEKGIIPCKGRTLHEACYVIQVKFTNALTPSTKEFKYLYMLLFGVLLLLAFLLYKRKQRPIPKTKTSNCASLGSFQFYPDQNKLVKQAIEINLSKKECELLAIFVANPNQIIKRDELTKRVWEDNGVIVGRSLDTYISKLRKKLQADDTIKLTNVHGVGYKLEVL